ncbi:hypothetical protein [Nocardioides convexus]|uniref:hypothetical protein n=1 Tax=Nocardioides convexus TaxID=2712224 RepID=UPI002418335E|nr:hypothetical protein [Nocardioides convexus]
MTAGDATPTEEIDAPPAHWEGDVLLRDGRTAHIRPIRPEDDEFAGRVLRAGLRRVEVLPLLLPDAGALRARRTTLHPRRPQGPGGADPARAGADDRRRPLRRGQRARGRGRLPRRGRPPGPRHRAGSCSSTWPRPGGSGAWSGSRPRSCPTTAG